MLDSRRRALLKKRLEERKNTVSIGGKLTLTFNPNLRYRVGTEFVGAFEGANYHDDPPIKVKVTP